MSTCPLWPLQYMLSSLLAQITLTTDLSHDFQRLAIRDSLTVTWMLADPLSQSNRECP